MSEPKPPPDTSWIDDSVAEAGWVRRAAAKQAHDCHFPSGGDYGDLWRCTGCGKLWRVARACDQCDYYGGAGNHRGVCVVGSAFRPARLSQRIRHWLTWR